MTGADSAGVPWEGRSFGHEPSSGDDGSAPERLAEAIRRFRAHELGQADVVDAVRESRLLIPLLAVIGEPLIGDNGLLADKTQELSIVTVAGPDGRGVLPVFSSVDAMRSWNPLARPVPADGRRVALAAASEETDLVVLDPTSTGEFAIRRPALWAIAKGEPWVPSFLDDVVLDEVLASVEAEEVIVAVQLAPGDPDARLVDAELVVQISLVDGLDRAALDDVIARVRARWSVSEVIASRVDSMAVRLAGVSR